MAKKLFVGSVPWSSTDETLSAYFSQAGTVESCQIITDRMTGRSKGFAFVEMATDEEAAKAVEMFHDKEFEGRKLVVNEARPKEDRPAGARRSFGGGGGTGGGFRREGGFGQRDDSRMAA